MSSMKKENGQSPDASNYRRSGGSTKNDSESTHNGPSLGPAGGYDQRRSHAYSDYGANNTPHNDYAKYYSPYNDAYGGGGWSAGGFYHHPGQNVGSPMIGVYGGNSTFFGNGANGPPPSTNHSGYYYNYFPTGSTNERDYNTWSGPNLVSAHRPGGGSKHAEFYHTPANDYVAVGGYGRGTGFTHHRMDQDMARMSLYDDPSTDSSNYHSKSSFPANSDSKKKSWANVAGQPAKSTSGTGPFGRGRGKGRGIPIGGVPGSTRSTESYFEGNHGRSSNSPGFWASSPVQNRAPAISTQLNSTSNSSVPAIGHDKTSSRPVNLDRNIDSGNNWNSNSPDRNSTRKFEDYAPVAELESTPTKRQDHKTTNGFGAESEDGGYVSEKKAVSGSGYGQRSNDVNATISKKLSIDDYNPKEFILPMKGARFFVIKSYSEDDVHRSIKYGIWCSTDHGNKRLDAAFKEREGKGPIYLLYSVNASGHFCGVAQMTSALDYETDSGVWAQDKWKGQFTVKWIYVKDVPNQQLRHIRLENNENKPVTNSRDTQEVPPEKGRQVVKAIHNYAHTTSLFDDFAHYEKRQEEENARKGKRSGNQEDYYASN